MYFILHYSIYSYTTSHSHYPPCPNARCGHPQVQAHVQAAPLRPLKGEDAGGGVH